MTQENKNRIGIFRLLLHRNVLRWENFSFPGLCCQVVVIVLLSPFFSQRAAAQVFAVSSNVALDALQMPSLAVEFTTGNSYSVALSGFGCYKPWGQDARIVSVQPEVRWWLSRRPMHKHFIGVALPMARYKIECNSKVYDGYGLGIGVTFGYVISLSSRWNIGLHAGVQNFFYKQKEYWHGDPYDERYILNGRHDTNASGTYFLPTHIGASIAYIIQ